MKHLEGLKAFPKATSNLKQSRNDLKWGGPDEKKLGSSPWISFNLAETYGRSADEGETDGDQGKQGQNRKSYARICFS